MKQPKKQELRQEICELRHVGQQMSNVCFNLAQGTKDINRELMDQLRKQWDAIQRRFDPNV